MRDPFLAGRNVKLLLILLCFVSLSGLCVAESELARSSISKALSCEGKKMLSKELGEQRMASVQGAYARLGSLAARFSQESFLAALDVAETSSGEVWFGNPGKMRWHYTKPEPQDFVVVDNTFWFYQPEDQQVTIDTFKAVALSDLPIAFLMGLGDLKRDFDLVKLCEGESLDGQKLVVMELADKKKSDEAGASGKPTAEGIDGLILAVSEATSLPVGAQVRHLGGNSTSVMFEESKVDSTLASDIFELSWPKSVDVIDRR
jgi:outer membrane lipoprotein-sorting protein